MIIWGAILIPFITSFILYKFYARNIVWWEIGVLSGVSLVFIITMKLLIEFVQVQSKEYWGSFVKQVEYYEDWNEYIHRTCTGTMSCGKNCTTTYTYDCSYVQYHPEYWQITTTTDERVGISKSEYNRLKGIFANEYFVDMHRNYFTDDGDAYYSVWGKDSANAILVTTTHSYENRIKASDQTAFHFKTVHDIEKKKFDLKEYPEIKGYQMDYLIGDTSTISSKGLGYTNGLLGHKKEVCVFMLIFKNKPIEAALYQESYWSGGNMNEFVVCVGVDSKRRVKWCKPFSWTKSEKLKIVVRDFIQSQDTFDTDKSIYFIRKEVDGQFKRRDFKEFNYLTIEPPSWAIALTYFLTVVINFFVARWAVKNSYSE